MGTTQMKCTSMAGRVSYQSFLLDGIFEWKQPLPCSMEGGRETSQGTSLREGGTKAQNLVGPTLGHPFLLACRHAPSQPFSLTHKHARMATDMLRHAIFRIGRCSSRSRTMTEAISRPLASSLPCTRHCNSTAKSAIRLPRNDSSLRPTPTLLQRVARIRLLSSLLPSIGARSSSSLHTSAEHTSPPPPPPPPPPPSSSTLSIPSNLVLADPSVLTAFKPVSVEDRLKKKEEMEGIIDPKLLTLPVRKSIGDVNQEEAETINLDSR